MSKPPGGRLLRKQRLRNKALAWIVAAMRNAGVQCSGRLDLRNQRHRAAWEAEGGPEFERKNRMLRHSMDCAAARERRKMREQAKEKSQ